MGRFSDLDIFIRQKSLNTKHYLALRHEINNYLNNPSIILSPTAQEIIGDWELYCQEILAKS